MENKQQLHWKNRKNQQNDTDDSELEKLEDNPPISKCVATMFLLLTISGWGCTVIFAILAFRRNETSLVQNFTTLAAGKCFGLLFLVQLPTAGIKGIVPTIPKDKSWVVLFTVLIPPFSAVAYVLYGFAVQINSGASSIQTICQLHAMFPIVFGIVILKEKISFAKAFGIIIMLSGCTLLGVAGESSQELSFAGLMLTMVCVCLWGFTYTANMIFCKYYDSKKYNEAIYFGAVSLFVTWFVIACIIEVSNAQKESRKFNLQSLITINLASIFLFLSQLTNETVSCLYTQTGKVFDASILSPITQLFNIYPIVFCIVYYEETVTIYKVIGCTFTMLGAVYLSAVSTNKNESMEKNNVKEVKNIERNKKTSDAKDEIEIVVC